MLISALCNAGRASLQCAFKWFLLFSDGLSPVHTRYTSDHAWSAMSLAYPISSVVLIALVAVVIVGFAKGSVDNWVHLTDPDSKSKIENIPPISCNVQLHDGTVTIAVSLGCY